MQANPNGAVSAPASITIDRNQRKALLAAINTRLSHYEPIYDAIANHDRALMAEACDEFPIVFSILNSIDYYEDEGLRGSFTVPVDARWMEALMEYYEPQIRGCIEDSMEQLQEALLGGPERYELGGSKYRAEAELPPRVRFNWNVRELRESIAEDTDELAGLRSIRAALTAEDAGSDDPR
jgi:hypothetical protein